MRGYFISLPVRNIKDIEEVSCKVMGKLFCKPKNCGIKHGVNATKTNAYF